MTFKEDDISQPIETKDVSWDYIHKSLLRINPASKSFFILTDPITGSYMQCAGSADRLIVELRKYDAETFKHFVLGKGDHKSPLKTVWTTIECKIGLIRVHDSEVLNITDALNLFHSFFLNSDVPDTYTKRNVTKLYTQT